MADLQTPHCSGSGISLDVADGFRWRIETMYRDMLARELVSGLSQPENEALSDLAQAYIAISQFADTLPNSNYIFGMSCQASILLDGSVGKLLSLWVYQSALLDVVCLYLTCPFMLPIRQ